MKGFNLGVNSITPHLGIASATVLPATAEVRQGDVCRYW